MAEVSSPVELARFIEYSLLRPDASAREVEKLCAEARLQNFFGVCVNGARVLQARHLLEDTDVKVIACVGFPLGAAAADVKRYETEIAIDEGTHEIDVVLNLGRLKDGDDKAVLRELCDVVEAADERPVKVILETSLLTRAEKLRACALVVESGAHFVKTSTGFSPGGATVDDVKLLREAVGAKFGVVASAGVRDVAMAQALIAAGATRLGTFFGLSVLKSSRN